jgi:DNA-binding CsgD family transcriptional regulator
MKTELFREKTLLSSNNLSALDFNEAIAEKVDLVCAPLFQHFGMTHFGHIKIFNDGTMFRVANNKKWTRTYFENGYYNDAALYSMQDLSEDRNHLLLLSGEPQGDHQNVLCKDFNVWNAIAIYEKFSKYNNFWFFATSQENTEAIDFYINKTDLLKKFLLYFQEKLKDELNNISPDQLIYSNIPTLNNCNTDKEKVKSFFDKLNIKSYQLSEDLNISKKEFECLFYLVQGKTLKEIGRLTGIPFRTSEFYVQNLKKKVKCKKKSELIDYFLHNKAFHSILPRF